MTLCTVGSASTVQQSRAARRVGRLGSGKTCPQGGANRPRDVSSKVRTTYRRSLDPCDNSDDSGIGFDHHFDSHQHSACGGLSGRLTWSGEPAAAKRPKLDIKLEHEEQNDNYCFPESIKMYKEDISLIRTAPSATLPSLSLSSTSSSSTTRTSSRCLHLQARQTSGSVPLTTQLTSTSRYTDASLVIVKQPEQQHRARYQTEGSRGAVKDREGNGFPVVQLTGYHKPTTLQVFIGTDVGKVSPHMFYQACKVSGKNSTPCIERKIDGTCVIELQLEPSKDMSATCDCVGILKERNVDVEHRFPDQLGNRGKKKSTRCRMIFRTTLMLDDGSQETLQVCSQPIVCTQPPGIPEICKKSLTSCPATGGLELFVLGKNFLKDTKVYFQQYEDGHVQWEKGVVPDKEYLQQTHFVCVVPPYHRPDITKPISVRLCVVSSGKTSESHHFVYTPVNGTVASVVVDTPVGHPSASASAPPFFRSGFWQNAAAAAAMPQAISKREQDLDMMPPPESSLVPLASRRSSINLTCDAHSPPVHMLKQEYVDENSQSSMQEHERYRHISESSLDVHHGDSNMSMVNDNSLDMMHQMSQMSENSNISVGKEDTPNDVEIMSRRNKLSSCENTNSSMSNVNDDSTSQPSILPRLLSNDREKVMDLTMKMPTASDLSSTSAPTMATLQRFGISENITEPLPSQSAQSVESYLNKIEAKPSVIPMTNPPGMLMKNDLSEKLTHIISASEPPVYQVQKSQHCGMITNTTPSLSYLAPNVASREAVYLSSNKNYMSNTSQQTEAANIVAKSEGADIAERSIGEQTNTTITTMASSIERSVPTPINTERLDALVNSTVETHLSPTRTDTAPKDDLAIPSQDVLLNTQNNLMVSPAISTRLSSPIEMQHNHTPPNLSSEVILNSQISPSLMCRSNETLLPTMCQASVETNLLPAPTQNLLVPSGIAPSSTPLTVSLVSEPEKAVLLKAAVDLLETQKKISELGTTKGQDIGSITSPSTTALSHEGTFVQPQPFPVTEVQQSHVAAVSDKKSEDRMIPQSFTSLTENELINLINPSCFDQV